MSILDTLIFGYRTIRGASGDLASRTILRFVGASVTDDPANGATIVTVPSPASISTATPQAVSTTGTAGSTGTISDAGHVHALALSTIASLGASSATPAAVATSAAVGTSQSYARDDHVHAIGESVLRSLGGALTAPLSLNGQRLTSVASPSAQTDAATKLYVDGLFNGRDWKQSVRLATAAPLPSCTYQVGFVDRLDASANGALTVDGVAVAVNDRILVKDQAAGLQNGIYSVVATGGASATWRLQRSDDALDGNVLTTGAACFVAAGTVNAGAAYFLDTADPITVGTTALVWGQLPDATVAGTGLSRTGNTLSISAGTSSQLVSGTGGAVSIGDGLQLTGSTLATSSSGSSLAVTQSAHGFAAGDAIYYTGTAWAKAKADAAATLGVAIVSAVADSSHFTAQFSGPITGLSGLTAGQYYFVSDSTAGAMTTTEPTAATSYSNPVLLATSTTAGIVLPYRPAALGPAVKWPGAVGDLTAGDGTKVTVGSGLALSGGTVATADIGCRVYNSANIAVANTTAVYLTFNSEEYDTDSMHSTSANTGRITVNTAGKYYLYTNVEFSGYSAGSASGRELVIRKNGTTLVADTTILVPASVNQAVRLVTVAEQNCAAGDYFEVGCYHDCGASLNVVAAACSPYFGARRVA